MINQVQPVVSIGPTKLFLLYSLGGNQLRGKGEETNCLRHPHGCPAIFPKVSVTNKVAPGSILQVFPPTANSLGTHLSQGPWHECKGIKLLLHACCFLTPKKTDTRNVIRHFLYHNLALNKTFLLLISSSECKYILHTHFDVKPLFDMNKTVP